MATQMKGPEMGTEELSSPATIKAAVAEFIAVAFFVFVGVGSIAAFIVTAAGGGILLIAVAFGLTIALLAAAIGPISRGHINPAVTFSMVITNRITVTRGAMYVVAQLGGAVLGSLLLKAFLSADVIDQIPGAGGNAIDDSVVPSTLAALGIEAFMTGLLVWTVFATAVSPKGNAVIAPLAIGFAVLVIHLVTIPFTGAGVNPARTFGPALVFNEWGDHWVYWVGPLLGAAVASLLYYYLYLMEDERTAATDT